MKLFLMLILLSSPCFANNLDAFAEGLARGLDSSLRAQNNVPQDTNMPFYAQHSNTINTDSAAPFCVQDNGGLIQCLFYSADNCQRFAHDVNGLCISNPNK